MFRPLMEVQRRFVTSSENAFPRKCLERSLRKSFPRSFSKGLFKKAFSKKVLPDTGSLQEGIHKRGTQSEVLCDSADSERLSLGLSLELSLELSLGLSLGLSLAHSLRPL